MGSTQMKTEPVTTTITLPPETLSVSGRADGITSFNEEFDSHPGRVMWKDYIQSYAYLDPLEQAQHKLANSPTYVNYTDAMRFGIQIYNQRTNGGLDDVPPGT